MSDGKTGRDVLMDNRDGIFFGRGEGGEEESSWGAGGDGGEGSFPGVGGL